MHRYWITFDDAPPFFPLGFGVTALDPQEALGLIRNFIAQSWPKLKMPEQAKIRVDVDVSALQNSIPGSHIGIPCNRGIWYPRVNIGSFYSPVP
jgi:hypothetical protein